MNRKHVLIMTVTEVRKDMREFFTDLLRDTAADVVAGDSPVPAIVLQKGIKNLTCEELVQVSSVAWAEMRIVAHNEVNKENPVVAILMYDGERTYLLAPEQALYRSDFEKNPIKE